MKLNIRKFALSILMVLILCLNAIIILSIPTLLMDLDFNIASKFKSLLDSIKSITITESSINILIQALLVIITVMNTVYIVKFRREDRKKEELSRKRNIQSYWYHNMILDKKIEDIMTFFDWTIDTLKKSNDRPTQTDGFMIEFIRKKTNISKNVNGPLMIINEEISDELERILDEYEDVLTEAVGGILEGNNDINSNVTSLIHIKNKYLNELYMFELKDYNKN